MSIGYYKELLAVDAAFRAEGRKYLANREEVQDFLRFYKRNRRWPAQ